MKSILIGFLLLFATTVRAQWPVSLHWNGVSLGYPKIAPDGHNGVFVAGSGLAFDGWDTFLFHVDSTGQSLWDESDSACYIGPGNQYPTALYADGTGGCVMLMDEELTDFPHISHHRVQVIRYNAEGNKVWSFMPYDTTMDDLHGFGTMTLVNDQVDVFWYNSVIDSNGDWMARMRVSDGALLDNATIRHVGTAGIRQAGVRRDSVFLLARDSISALNPSSGIISAFHACRRLYAPRMLMTADSILILGLTTADGNSPYLLQCVKADTAYPIDTIVSAVGLEICVTVRPDSTIIGYAQGGDLFGRTLHNDGRVGAPYSVCNAQGDQYYILSATGAEGIGLSWSDRPGRYPRVFIQQLNQTGFRWPNGLLVSDSMDFMNVCDGNRFGYIVYEFDGYFFRVQPIDSLSQSPVPDSNAPMVRLFTLHDPYPNPFNSTLNISFSSHTPSNIQLSIYNLLGEKVKVILNGNIAAGDHFIQWEASEASGIYWLCLSTPTDRQFRKIVLLR